MSSQSIPTRTCCAPQVLKLHTKMGKPIPSSDPIKVNTAATSTAQSAAGKAAASVTSAAGAAAAKAKPVVKKVVTPKITFVGESSSPVPGLFYLGLPALSLGGYLLAI